MKRLDSQSITRDTLHQLYVVEDKGVLEIARLLRRRNGSVVEALRAHGFITRPTKEWMSEKYEREHMSVDDIATMLRCTESNVRYYLRSYGIPIRYKTRGSPRISELNNPHWLYQRYVEERMGAAVISDVLGCNVSSVVRALVRYHITRGHSERPWRSTPDQRYFAQKKKRREIMTRDGFACRLCGSFESLEIHHIIPVSQGGTNEPTNGITLCERCHDATNGKEESFIAQFQSLLQGHSA